MNNYLPIEDIILGMAEIVYENRQLRKENLKLLKEKKEHEEFAQSIFKSTQERQINLLNILCGNKENKNEN